MSMGPRQAYSPGAGGSAPPATSPAQLPPRHPTPPQRPAPAGKPAVPGLNSAISFASPPVDSPVTGLVSARGPAGVATSGQGPTASGGSTSGTMSQDRTSGGPHGAAAPGNSSNSNGGVAVGGAVTSAALAALAVTEEAAAAVTGGEAAAEAAPLAASTGCTSGIVTAATLAPVRSFSSASSQAVTGAAGEQQQAQSSEQLPGVSPMSDDRSSNPRTSRTSRTSRPSNTPSSQLSFLVHGRQDSGSILMRSHSGFGSMRAGPAAQGQGQGTVWGRGAAVAAPASGLVRADSGGPMSGARALRASSSGALGRPGSLVGGLGGMAAGDPGHTIPEGLEGGEAEGGSGASGSSGSSWDCYSPDPSLHTLPVLAISVGQHKLKGVSEPMSLLEVRYHGDVAAAAVGRQGVMSGSHLAVLSGSSNASPGPNSMLTTAAASTYN